MKKQWIALIVALVLMMPVMSMANADAAPSQEDGVTVGMGEVPGGMPAEIPPEISGGSTGTDAPEMPISTGPEVQNHPKIVIDSYKTEPEQVQAGDNFSLQMTFYNTNGVNSIRNMKITLVASDSTQASGPVFIPAGTSNTFYSRYLAPEGEVTKRIDMYVVPDASQRTYTLTANFEYEDADGNQFTTSENISIPVVQKSELTLGQTVVNPEMYTYQQEYISVPLYNTGKTTLYNVTAKIESPFAVETPQKYMGNMASGTQDTYDISFTPDAPGEVEGKIIVQYQDVSGKQYEQTIPFKTQVIEMMDPTMEDPMMEEPIIEENPPIFMSPLFWIGALALLILIVVLVRRRKQKKEDRELEIHD